MRIISKFKDYYDIGLQQGQDEEIVYSRQTTTLVDQEEDRGLYEECVRGPRHQTSERELLIGFCGRLYPVVRSTIKVPANGQFDKYETQYCYSAEQLEDHRAACLRRKWLDSLGTSIAEGGIFGPGPKDRLNAGSFENTQPFTEHQVPILLAYQPRYGDKPLQVLQLNPRLADMDFFRCVDPWTAFQEIQMYVGGVLGSTGRDMAKVSDEHRYAGHGYDKQSFRQPAGRKKRKGKRKNG